MNQRINVSSLLAMSIDGDDEHLDDLLDAPPAQGSKLWLPIVDQLCTSLLPYGIWTIKLPLGVADHWPGASVDRSTVFDLVDTSFLLEPPSVLRRSTLSILRGNDFEICEVRRWVAAGITESIIARRSLVEAYAGEPYSMAVFWELSSGHDTF